MEIVRIWFLIYEFLEHSSTFRDKTVFNDLAYHIYLDKLKISPKMYLLRGKSHKILEVIQITIRTSEQTGFALAKVCVPKSALMFCFSKISIKGDIRFF